MASFCISFNCFEDAKLLREDISLLTNISSWALSTHFILVLLIFWFNEKQSNPIPWYAGSPNTMYWESITLTTGSLILRPFNLLIFRTFNPSTQWITVHQNPTSYGKAFSFSIWFWLALLYLLSPTHEPLCKIRNLTNLLIGLTFKCGMSNKFSWAG